MGYQKTMHYGISEDNALWDIRIQCIMGYQKTMHYGISEDNAFWDIKRLPDALTCVIYVYYDRTPILVGAGIRISAIQIKHIIVRL